MNKLVALGLILAFFLIPLPAWAQVGVNKFGIHILEPTDLPRARELVNSGGGDWGFVTVVIRDDDRNAEKWQQFFDDCRKFHLVPIVRIATHLSGDTWTKPTLEDIDSWANFLAGLNWPVKNRYVIVFNEPNHQKEWGGKISPQEYSQILRRTSEVFKSKSANFQILNAGFDLAAPNSSQTMDALEFWRQMEKEVPGIFSRLDGWASHSYPNHGYIGTPTQGGRTSIRGYQWELAILKNRFGINDLPVFITETGWPYNINLKFKIENLKFYSQEITTKYIKQAYENVWLPDKRVVAVTPFVLYYPQPPFENFSWITKDSQVTPQYLAVQELPKVSWWPEQGFGLKLERITLPPFLPTSTTFTGKIEVRNIGQSIWGERGPVELVPQGVSTGLEISPIKISPDLLVKPDEAAEIDFTLKSTTRSGELTFSWEQFPEFKIAVIPSGPLVRMRYTLWQKIVFWLEEKLLF